MRRYLLNLCVGAAAISPAAHAEVEVDFVAPEEYRDANLYGHYGARGREPALRAISEHLTELGERYLPAHEDLRIEVVDIDLASEIEWWHSPYEIRYLRSVTWPRIEVRYILEEAGKVTEQAEETISDPSYLMRARPARVGESLPHEKRMLTRWFRMRFENESEPES